MRMASEGLFPQLIVIPLHRDHGVITMAAGKNDVIKLLPPLTLSESEAQQLPRRARRRARRLPRRRQQELGGRARHRHRDAAPPRATRRRAPSRAATAPSRARPPVDPSRDNVCLITGASGFIGGHLAQRLVHEGYQVRCLVRAEQRHLAAGRARGRDRGRRPHRRRARSPAPPTGCRYVFHCGALVSDWATTEEIDRDQRRGHAEPARGVRRRIGAALRSLQHHRCVWLSRRRRDRRVATSPTRFRNWYAQTKLRRRGRGPPRRSGARARRRHPAPGDRLRPRFERGRRRDRARDPRPQHAPGRRRPRGRRPVLRRQPDRRRRCSRCATTPRPARRSTSPTASTSPGGSSPTAWPRPRLPAGPLEPAVLAGQRHRLRARARLPAAAQDDAA